MANKETRTQKIVFSKAGGNASKTATTAKLSLPKAWLADLGLTPEERNVQLQFDGETITIRKIDIEENK